jgi:hypothetical protein
MVANVAAVLVMVQESRRVWITLGQANVLVRAAADLYVYIYFDTKSDQPPSHLPRYRNGGN